MFSEEEELPPRGATDAELSAYEREQQIKVLEREYYEIFVEFCGYTLRVSS